MSYNQVVINVIYTQLGLSHSNNIGASSRAVERLLAATCTGPSTAIYSPLMAIQYIENGDWPSIYIVHTGGILEEFQQL